MNFALLRLAVAAIMLGLAAAGAASQAQPIAVTIATTGFSPLQFGRRNFGRLEFLGGIEVSSDDPRFGGFSGLVMAGDGRRLAAVSDDGWLLTAGLDYADGYLSGLHDAAIAPLVGPDGKRPRSKWRRDAEALAVWDERGIDGPLLVGYESKPRLEVIEPSAVRPTRRLAVPRALAKGPANGEVEAVARILDGPHKGWLIALSEKNFDADGHIRGWLWKADRTEELRIKRYSDYVITDMAVLPGGRRFITAERSFSPPAPPGMALRLFDLPASSPDAPLDGEVVIEARQPIYAIDNMEAIAVHQGADGGLVVTVMSDDNYNRTLQRTIILQFALRE